MKTFFTIIISPVVILLTFGAFNYAMLPGDLGMIDQLRKDARDVSALSSEDVIGQATAWNQKIAQYRPYNIIPIIEIAIPDFWEEVEYIPVPGTAEEQSSPSKESRSPTESLRDKVQGGVWDTEK